MSFLPVMCCVSSELSNVIRCLKKVFTGPDAFQNDERCTCVTNVTYLSSIWIKLKSIPSLLQTFKRPHFVSEFFLFVL
jgi:hypothetical protein